MNKIANKVRYFYQNSENIYYLDDDSSEPKQQLLKNKVFDAKNNINYYEVFGGYDPNNNGLMKYKEDFNRWYEEIL